MAAMAIEAALAAKAAKPVQTAKSAQPVQAAKTAKPVQPARPIPVPVPAPAARRYGAVPPVEGGTNELDLLGLDPGLLRLVTEALREDLFPSDATTTLTIPKDLRGRAAVAARAPMVVSGLEPLKLAFTVVDPGVKVDILVKDGDRAAPGARLAEVEGPAASILAAERVALNFLARLSGVATLTRAFVDQAGPGGPRILDTRKTTPLLRSLEKAAVLHGGGHNHRFNLHDGILIKDNHIQACGSITAAVALAKAGKPHLLGIEVEVDDLGQLAEALDAGVDVVLLDNMDPATLKKAVAITEARFEPAPRRTLLEASGGVTLANVGRIAKTGVDMISVGALTHSAPAADIGLDWISAANGAGPGAGI
jgi:nicotinate-nucleotide pyrophosphorylase (carboxylating)